MSPNPPPSPDERDPRRRSVTFTNEKSPAAGVERGNADIVEPDLWAQIQGQVAKTDSAGPNLWIPSGLGLDLGLDGSLPASDDLYYLSTDGYNPIDSLEGVSLDETSSMGMRQTLFDIGSQAGPLSAVTSDFSTPFDFSTSRDSTRNGDEAAVELLSDELALGSGTAEWDALSGTMMDVQ